MCKFFFSFAQQRTIIAPKCWRTLSTFSSNISVDHAKYIEDIARFEAPRELCTLLTLLEMNGNEIIPPRKRKDLIPFLIPLSKLTNTNNLLCYIRWPTQKDSSPLQLVTTTETGVYLYSPSTISLCQRILVEMDFHSHSHFQTATSVLQTTCPSFHYTQGDYLTLFKDKFPKETLEQRERVLTRYLLTVIGPFPDLYDRLISEYLLSEQTVTALVTCERAISLFYGYGHPTTRHAQILREREKHARDVAVTAITMPLWTAAKTTQELENIVKLAGYTDTQALAQLHMIRSKDERLSEIGEKLSPMQVSLDQAAHLMDAVTLGVKDQDWLSVRPLLAQKYNKGGYSDMSAFILDYE
mmetsp:Transcript_19847/g.19954  ORF Transcript_19847/g.19954 Transcript_19847/m.19954 type:complete len:355 (-) Transcript_19847:59-1123(-)